MPKKSSKAHSGNNHHIHHHLPQTLNVLIVIVGVIIAIAGLKFIQGDSDLVGQSYTTTPVPATEPLYVTDPDADPCSSTKLCKGSKFEEDLKDCITDAKACENPPCESGDCVDTCVRAFESCYEDAKAARDYYFDYVCQPLIENCASGAEGEKGAEGDTGDDEDDPCKKKEFDSCSDAPNADSDGCCSSIMAFDGWRIKEMKRHCKTTGKGDEKEQWCVHNCDRHHEACPGATNGFWSGRDNPAKWADCCNIGQGQACQKSDKGNTCVPADQVDQVECSNDEMEYVKWYREDEDGNFVENPSKYKHILYTGMDDGGKWYGKKFKPTCYTCDKNGKNYCTHPSGKRVEKSCDACVAGSGDDCSNVDPSAKEAFDKAGLVFEGEGFHRAGSAPGGGFYIEGSKGSRVYISNRGSVFYYDADTKKWYREDVNGDFVEDPSIADDVNIRFPDC